MTNSTGDNMADLLGFSPKSGESASRPQEINRHDVPELTLLRYDL
jgi:hypothetical protein